MTKQRKAVVAILHQSKAPLTAEEIFKNVQDINLSTIYRTLSVLSENGHVLKSIGQDGKAYYQPNSPRHGHQLVCSQCKRIVMIDVCPITEMAKRLEQETGYQIMGHNLEFIGLCPDCAERKGSMKNE